MSLNTPRTDVDACQAAPRRLMTADEVDCQWRNWGTIEVMVRNASVNERISTLEVELDLANRRKEYYRATFGKVCDKHTDDEILESCVFCALATANEKLKQANRLYELTLANEQRGMRLHGTADERLARLRELAKDIVTKTYYPFKDKWIHLAACYIELAALEANNETLKGNFHFWMRRCTTVEAETIEKVLAALQEDSVLGNGEYDQGLMCGVEDRGFQRDGISAMRFGYDSALERVNEAIHALKPAAAQGRNTDADQGALPAPAAATPLYGDFGGWPAESYSLPKTVAAQEAVKGTGPVTGDMPASVAAMLEEARQDAAQARAGIYDDIPVPAAAHTDHPARVWDRTCPACSELAAQAYINMFGCSDDPVLAAPNYKPIPGRWTLIDPNGRYFGGNSPLECVRLESEARIPAEVRLARIKAACVPTAEDLAEREALRLEGMQIAAKYAESWGSDGKFVAGYIRAEIERRRKNEKET